MDSDYLKVPPVPGVYILRVINYHTGERYLAYVGSSANLRKRRDNHSTISKLYKRHPHGHLVQFVFKQMSYGYLEYEKLLIKRLKPKFNTQHNGIEIYRHGTMERGLVL